MTDPADQPLSDAPDFEPESIQYPISPAAEEFYSGALKRIGRFMIAIALFVAVVLLVRFGVPVALGFLAGCVVAYLNFFWLKRAISAFTDRAVGQQTSGGVIGNYFVRYALIAAAGYGIFRVSRVSVYGFLAGIFLPVAAILSEAAYEAYTAYRRNL
jgi:hypothetical protein